MAEVTVMPGSTAHGEQFTNPYNFVSWELPLAEKEERYRRPYVTLDRYFDLSGRITCTLTTLTPFFVPTGHPASLTQDERTKHKSKAVLRLPDPLTGVPKPAIQATSLKGMIRSLIETATNSCYAVFTPEQHFSYRAKPTPLLMGIVTQQEDGNWILEKLEAARVSIEGNQKLLEKAPPQQRAAAKVVSHPQKPFIKNAENLTLLSENQTVPTGLTDGWLKATGSNLVENKRHEKFVFRKSGELYIIPPEVVKAYNEVLAEQNSPDPQRKKNYRTKLPHPDKLTSGDIVYFKEQRRPQRGLGSVEALGAVAVPRLQYRNPVGHYLPEVFHPCKSPNQLCPACRLFGWVRDAYKEGGTSTGRRDANNAAVMGRVHFSHAYAHSTLPEQSKQTLAILSAPKPTTTPFYLINNAQPDAYADYDQTPDPVLIRGRKFYWHFKPDRSQYLQPPKGERSKLEQQNEQTVSVELLGENSPVTFDFSIDFVNLEKSELGMLLWALEFDGEEVGQVLRHKLGMGKPLGLGTVHIQVTGLELHAKVAAYNPENLFSPPVQTGQDRETYKAAFKSYLEEVFGLAFGELRTMLNAGSIPHPHEVHYPRLPDRQNPALPDRNQPESFRWFVQNNRLLNRRQEPHTMPTPEEEVSKPEFRLPTDPR